MTSRLSMQNSLRLINATFILLIMKICSSAYQRDHPLAEQSTLLLNMLTDEPLVLFNTDSVQVMTLTRQFKAAGVNPHIVLNTSQITTLINMVKADKIGCFLYKSMVDMYPDLVGIPVFPAIEQRIGVIWRKGKYQNAVTEKVIRYLKNY